MLSSPTMEHSTENESDLLASAIIGIFGVSLLLIPARLNLFIAGQSNWLIVATGIFAFSISLSVQIVSLFQSSQKQSVLIRSAGIFFLILFAGLLLEAGCYVEAIIVLCTAATQHL